MGRTARAAEDTHGSREQDQTEMNPVHELEDEPWVRPTSLNAPPARKGYRQRWIRVATMGNADATNISRKFREGWKPRPVETIPPQFEYPTIQTGRFAGFVGVEGMVLCEMPEKRAQARDKHYRGLTKGRTDAIDRQLMQAGEILKGRGFGPIVVDEKTSTPVREVAVAQDVDQAE